jgi:hypothetical protein
MRRLEMARPIYVNSFWRYRDAWYQLSPEEYDNLLAKMMESFERVGGKVIIACTSRWSSEEWENFAVVEYPDIEAVQRHHQDLQDLKWFRYYESSTMLGTEWEES